MRIKLKYLLPVVIPLFILILPTTAFPFDGLTLMQQRTIALFLFAALCWILEPVPVYATSVCVIVLELIMMSDKGLIWFKQGVGSSEFGQLLSYKAIMATFADPIIMLFLGGFFLAMAASKYRLDVNLARVLLKPFGNKPRNVMAGLMLITGIFSMFMSNTATTVMMLAMLTPIIVSFKSGDPGRTAFALCVPVAANIGGLGTPIGTPPNAVALAYLTEENTITFGEWMAFAVPYVMIMLVIAWLILLYLYPANEKTMSIDIDSKFSTSPKAIIVYVTLAITIVLWLLGSAHGMNAETVAMIPVTVFSMLGIINTDDLKNVSWDVLWLVSGGIALGMAIDKTGLAKLLVHSIPFASFSPFAVMLGASMLAYLMANFMSRTATGNLLMPIMAALGVSVASLDEFGGQTGLILAVTFVISLGMCLPISTPPNALAHATGMVSSKQMVKSGLWIGVIGIVLAFIMVWILKMVTFI